LLVERDFEKNSVVVPHCDFNKATEWSEATLPATNNIRQINGVCTVDRVTLSFAYGNLVVGFSSAGTIFDGR